MFHRVGMTFHKSGKVDIGVVGTVLQTGNIKSGG